MINKVVTGFGFMVSTETNLVNWKMIFYTKKGGEDDLLSLSIVGEPENLV